MINFKMKLTNFIIDNLCIYSHYEINYFQLEIGYSHLNIDYSLFEVEKGGTIKLSVLEL